MSERHAPRIRIAIADDHTLMRMALAQLLDKGPFKVVAQAENGRHLIELLNEQPVEVVLMDINMPEMNGFEATYWLHKHKPEIRVLALSMFADDTSVIRMIKSGAKGYVLKDAEPQVLQEAIVHVHEHGFFYSDLFSDSMVNKANAIDGTDFKTIDTISERESEFLKYTCSDLSMKEIADRMNVSPRTVDGYREQLFQKLRISSRVGLVLYALKHRICFIE